MNGIGSVSPFNITACARCQKFHEPAGLHEPAVYRCLSCSALLCFTQTVVVSPDLPRVHVSGASSAAHTPARDNGALSAGQFYLEDLEELACGVAYPVVAD